MRNNKGNGSIYKRGDIWWIFYIDPYTKKRIRESSKSHNKNDAEELLRYRLKNPADKKSTVNDLLGILIDDYKKRGLKSVDKTISRISTVREHIGHIRVVDLNEETIQYYQNTRLKKVSKATVNRECQLIGQSFKIGVLKRIAPRTLIIRKLKENNARTGFFEPHEVERLLTFLPAYLQDLIRFLHITGWRKSEGTTLTWDNVHFASRIIHLSPHQSKNEEGRILPLVGALEPLIQRRQADRLEGCPWVFHRNGEFIRDFRKAWQKACEQAGLPGRLPHDLRRSTARDRIRVGIHERIVMATSGWKTRSVFDRYNIVSERDIEDALLKTEQYRSTQIFPDLVHKNFG